MNKDSEKFNELRGIVCINTYKNQVTLPGRKKNKTNEYRIHKIKSLEEC